MARALARRDLGRRVAWLTRQNDPGRCRDANELEACDAWTARCMFRTVLCLRIAWMQIHRIKFARAARGVGYCTNDWYHRYNGTLSIVTLWPALHAALGMERRDGAVPLHETASRRSRIRRRTHRHHDSPLQLPNEQGLVAYEPRERHNDVLVRKTVERLV